MNVIFIDFNMSHITSLNKVYFYKHNFHNDFYDGCIKFNSMDNYTFSQNHNNNDYVCNLSCQFVSLLIVFFIVTCFVCSCVYCFGTRRRTRIRRVPHQTVVV